MYDSDIDKKRKLEQCVVELFQKFHIETGLRVTRLVAERKTNLANNNNNLYLIQLDIE